MSGKRIRNTAKKLARRREAFEQVHATMNSPRTRGGYKRPGSLNPRKQG